MLLALATLSAVLSTLLRHFRASLASLPLLSQQIGDLPLGTWVAGAQPPEEQRQGQKALGKKGGRPKGKKVLDSLLTVQPGTPITQALGLLLETGVSCMPVVDDQGCLLDVFARADITLLARGNAYNQLQYEDIPVGQVLTLARPDNSYSRQAGRLAGKYLPPGACLLFFGIRVLVVEERSRVSVLACQGSRCDEVLSSSGSGGRSGFPGLCPLGTSEHQLPGRPQPDARGDGHDGRGRAVGDSVSSRTR